MTNCLGSAELRGMMDRLGLRTIEGRAALAPQVADDTSWMDQRGEPQEEQLEEVQGEGVNLMEVEGVEFDGSQEGILEGGRNVGNRVVSEGCSTESGCEGCSAEQFPQAGNRSQGTSGKCKSGSHVWKFDVAEMDEEKSDGWKAAMGEGQGRCAESRGRKVVERGLRSVESEWGTT